MLLLTFSRVELLLLEKKGKSACLILTCFYAQKQNEAHHTIYSLMYYCMIINNAININHFTGNLNFLFLQERKYDHFMYTYMYC